MNEIKQYIKKGNSILKIELEQCDHGSHIEQLFLYMKFVYLGRQRSSRKGSRGN